MSKSKLQRLLLPGHLTSLVVSPVGSRLSRLDDLIKATFGARTGDRRSQRNAFLGFVSPPGKRDEKLGFYPSQGHARDMCFFL